MERRIYYCDYCGRRIKVRPKPIKTIWSIVTAYFFPFSNEYTSIEGDGCNDCYKSFKKWVSMRANQFSR